MHWRARSLTLAPLLLGIAHSLSLSIAPGARALSLFACFRFFFLLLKENLFLPNHYTS